MKNINLLPRKTFLELYHVSLIIVVGAFSFLLTYSLLFYASSLAEDTLDKQAEIQQIERRISIHQEQIISDELTDTYNDAQQTLQSLLQNRKDWMTPLTYLLGYLPKTSIITTMGASNKGDLGAEIEFQSIEDYLAYMKKIQSVPIFENIIVKEFKFVPYVKKETNEEPTGEEEETKTPPILPDEAADLYNQLIEALANQYTDDANSDDSILDWDSSFFDSNNPFSTQEIVGGAETGEAFPREKTIDEVDEVEEEEPAKGDYYYANIELKVLFNHSGEEVSKDGRE